jgi:hypothetical protein
MHELTKAEQFALVETGSDSTFDTNHNGKIPQKKILLRLFAAKNFMSTAYQIVVCGSIVPDPLQTLEPARSFAIYDCRFTI